MTRRSMMGLVREGKGRSRGPGFLVSWDIDSRDQRAVARTQYFLFGRTFRRSGKEYVYRGFVWTEGVRYIAQSAVFVRKDRLAEIVRFLSQNRIDHDVTFATLS